MLQTVDEDIAAKAVPLIQAAHIDLTAKIDDYNERHIAATHAGHVKWASARKIVGMVDRMDKDARENAKTKLKTELTGIDMPDQSAEEIADYLSRIIVRSVRPGGEHDGSGSRGA